MGDADFVLSNALRFREPLFVRRDGDQGREGQRKRETLFFWENERKRPRGPKAQESKGPAPT
jgi:hypothetical protein